MQSLKRSEVTAAFESDADVLRVVRQHKFVVGRIPLPQFAPAKSGDAVYQISCDPKFDLRTQTVLFERALAALGYKSTDMRKSIMTTGLSPRFIAAVSQQGFVLYNIDKGLITVNLTRVQLPDNWTP